MKPQTKLKNFKLLIEYDGTNFCGWQIQPQKRSVQGLIREALIKITGQAVPVKGASRTDAGVHALGQVADVALKTNLSARQLHRALLGTLPPDMAVKKVSQCPISFSSRKHAAGKTYRYTILNSTLPAPFLRSTTLLVHSPLNLSAMRKAASYLRGKTDYASFQTKGSQNKKTTLKLFAVTLAKKGQVITITISGQYFLYKMCRTIVGTLLLVGKGKLRPRDLPGIIKGKDRSLAGPNAPAHGLCLMKVHY